MTACDVDRVCSAWPMNSPSSDGELPVEWGGLRVVCEVARGELVA